MLNHKVSGIKDTKLLVNIWEKSVLATHDFLQEKDFYEIKKILPTYFPELEILLWVTKKNKEVVGFSAMSDTHLEMLFLLPEKSGRGYGSEIIKWLTQHRQLKTVDVNEQNIPARCFYEKQGFEMVKRDPLDSEGRPYPILHLSYDITNI